MKSTLLQAALLAALTAVAAGAQAQNIDIKDAWVRSTVAGQKGTGGFMKITATGAAKLVGVSSPAAGVAEVHEMKMDGDMMRMRPVAALDLPAGKVVELKPGGYHLMLMDLKAPLPSGSTVPVTLLFTDAKGVQSKLELKLPVSTVAPGTAAGAPPAHHKH